MFMVKIPVFPEMQYQEPGKQKKGNLLLID